MPLFAKSPCWSDYLFHIYIKYFEFLTLAIYMQEFLLDILSIEQGDPHAFL